MIEWLPLTLQILRYYHTECIGESEARLTGPEKKKPDCLFPGNPAISLETRGFPPPPRNGFGFICRVIIYSMMTVLCQDFLLIT